MWYETKAYTLADQDMRFGRCRPKDTGVLPEEDQATSTNLKKMRTYYVTKVCHVFLFDVNLAIFPGFLRGIFSSSLSGL